jgi:hypothetical protein
MPPASKTATTIAFIHSRSSLFFFSIILPPKLFFIY